MGYLHITNFENLVETTVPKRGTDSLIPCWRSIRYELNDTGSKREAKNLLQPSSTIFHIYVYEFFFFFFESYICESWLQGIENILDNMIAGEGYFSSNTQGFNTMQGYHLYNINSLTGCKLQDPPYIYIGKLHMVPISLKSTTSPSISLLWDTELPVELQVIDNPHNLGWFFWN